MSGLGGVVGVTQRIAEINARFAGVTSQRAPAATSTGVPAFEATLRQAVADTAGAVHNGIPVELSRYGNGKVPQASLSPIGNGPHRMWAPAAVSFDRLQAAAARDGVTIAVTDSYRSYEQQVDVARRKGLYSQGGLAAKPGTSDHGWGLSVDLGLDSRAQAWMRANAGNFGFIENVAREPWHWTFRPG